RGRKLGGRREARAIEADRVEEHGGREVRGERERQAQRRGHLRAKRAGAENPDGHPQAGAGHRLHGLIGLRVGQELHHLEHVIGEVVGVGVQGAPKGHRGGPISARSATQPEIDSAGEQRLQRAELFGHLQRRVVRQHDPPGPNPDARCTSPHVTDQHGRGRAADAGHVVVLGQPEARVTQPLCVLRELQRAAESQGRRAALDDGGEIQDRERNHESRIHAFSSGGARPSSALSCVSMRPETRYAKSGDVNIAYQVVGEGPFDLVVVPGWISNVDFAWEDPLYGDWVRRLAAFSRVIVFDKRGTGLSDRDVGDSTLEERMDDLRAVLATVGSERAAVMGFSEGGALSMLFAATYPERVRALVLYATFARASEAPDYPEGAALRKNVELLRSTLETAWGQGTTLDLIAPGLTQFPRAREFMGRYERMC